MGEIRIIGLGQGGGPTPVINESLAGALYEAKLHKLIVYGFRNGLEGILHADVIGNIIDITSWEPDDVRTGPGAKLDTTRLKLRRVKHEERIEKVRENRARLNIDSFAYFGGEDSADQIETLGFGVHGSKTIDNNLCMSHHTPGYGSACLFNVVAVKNLTQDVGSYRMRGRMNEGDESYLMAPVTVYQTEGRDTGWLALGAGLAKVDPGGQINPKMPPDIIWPREIPFDAEVYLSTLSNVLQRKGKAFVIIGEELVDKNGIPLAELYGNDPLDQHGHAEHARVDSFNYAAHLARLAKSLRVSGVSIIKETPLVPKHIQRSYTKSNIDADEAFEVGRETVRAILDCNEMVSVVLQKIDDKITVVRVPIKEVAGKNRKVPLEYIDGIHGPTQKFADEFLYLIGGAQAIPHYPKLDYGKIITLNPR